MLDNETPNGPFKHEDLASEHRCNQIDQVLVMFGSQVYAKPQLEPRERLP